MGASVAYLSTPYGVPNGDIVISGRLVLFLRKNTVSCVLSEVSPPPFHRGLADTKQTGKLSREQFSLAMYLIQQKATKGVDPPSTLTPDMIPPSERTAASAVGPVSPDFSQWQPLLHLSIALFTEILPIFQSQIIHLHLYLKSLMFSCYYSHFKWWVLLSGFSALPCKTVFFMLLLFWAVFCPI